MRYLSNVFKIAILPIASHHLMIYECPVVEISGFLYKMFHDLGMISNAETFRKALLHRGLVEFGNSHVISSRLNLLHFCKSFYENPLPFFVLFLYSLGFSIAIFVNFCWGFWESKAHCFLFCRWFIWWFNPHPSIDIFTIIHTIFLLKTQTLLS